MNIPAPFSENQMRFFWNCFNHWFNVAEGGKRGGKNVLITMAYCTILEKHPSRIHLIAGVSTATARLNILDCDGFGLKNYFEGRCREGTYQNRDCLYIQTATGEKVVLVSGGGKSGDEKLIKGNTYGTAYMSILLGDMDTSGFMMAKDNISGEIVLHNRLTDTRIDHVVYETISQYLCAANGIEKHSEFAADEPTRIAMIEEARDNLEYQKTKHYEPHLAELVLSMACSSGFKADYFKAMDYPMSVFMNHVRKIQQIKSYDNTMHGVYAGTVEFGKIPKAQLDWTSKVD